MTLLNATFRLFACTAIAGAALAACSTVPPTNARLDEARSAYRDAQANSQTQSLAAAELKQAGDALALAEAAQARRDDVAQVDHLAYLTRQRVALAQQTAARKSSDAAVAAAGAARDQRRLAARTSEADMATQRASDANRDALASQRQSEAAQRQASTARQQASDSRQDAAAAQQESMAARQQTAAAQQQAASARQQAIDSQQLAAASQLQAGDAERRNQALESELRELNARKTDRGMVITMGDVLFDTNQAQIKSGGMQNIERLGGFLKQYPQRRASIEGYTDSTGSDDHNMTLSGRRADAVMSALAGMGVDRAQMTSQGYGETHPVAGNDSAGGRQMNRRVEIVLSDENGAVAPR